MMMGGAQRTVNVSWGQMVLAGVAAAFAWLVVAGLVSAIAKTGFWSPWIVMAANVSRDAEGLTTQYQFDLAGVILGFVVQMILSVVLAVLFGAIAARFIKGQGALVAAAVVFGLAIFLVMWYVVKEAVTPDTFELGVASYALGYIAWGVVLGMFVGRGVTFR